MISFVQLQPQLMQAKRDWGVHRDARDVYAVPRLYKQTFPLELNNLVRDCCDLLFAGELAECKPYQLLKTEGPIRYEQSLRRIGRGLPNPKHITAVGQCFCVLPMYVEDDDTRRRIAIRV